MALKKPEARGRLERKLKELERELRDLKGVEERGTLSEFDLDVNRRTQKKISQKINDLESTLDWED